MNKAAQQTLHRLQVADEKRWHKGQGKGV